MSSSRGTSSSRGKGMVPRPADEIEVFFAEKLVELRAEHKKRSDFQKVTGLEQEVVGGLIRSYRFDFLDGKNIAQGKVCIEFASNRHIECDATVVILGPDEGNEGITGERIVERTAKLADYPDLVLDAYFSTFCKKIERWIVVYEKFDHYFFEEDPESCPSLFAPFFDNEAKTELTAFWRDKMRSLMDLLYYGIARQVTHGGLSERKSYVVSSGTVKLIDVGRHALTYVHMKDVTDLNHFIWNEKYFGGSTSVEWQSLHMLLDSRLMRERHWEEIVLKHPILLGSADDKLTSYLEVCLFVRRLTIKKKNRFANVLYYAYPSYYHDMLDGHDDAVKRDKHLRKYVDMNDAVYMGLFNYRAPGTAPRTPMYGGFIHLEIINLVRNMIYHAHQYGQNLWIDGDMLEEIRSRFGSYMSMAYCLAHMEQDWQTLVSRIGTLPYPWEW